MFGKIDASFVSACTLAAAMLVPQHGSAANGFRVLYSFPTTEDGASPQAGLIKDSAGNLYGTTFYGGNTQFQEGTAFKLAPDGTKAVLHNFSGGPDGGLPAGLTMDSAGNLYGTTLQGGLTDGCNGHGCGVVFKIAPDGTQTVLYTFSGGSDGAQPEGAVILDRKGNLYSTTDGGGANRVGTVFRLTPDGKEKVLHSFADGSDGASPVAGPTMDKAGNLYGTTNYGGGGNLCEGFGTACGTIYKIAADGTETILYAFTGGIDGANPVGGLLMDKAGNLYGTTEFGGFGSGCGGAGCGTVFKLTPGGTFSVLYTFAGGSDGGQPVASLVGDREGNLYGTTLFWGDGYGVVFKLAPDGTQTVLHSFSNGNDGAYPWGALLKVSRNKFASTSSGGGDQNCFCGTVFKLRK